MTGIVIRFAVIMLVLCAALVAGMTFAGKVLQSRGQLVYMVLDGNPTSDGREIRVLDLEHNLHMTIAHHVQPAFHIPVVSPDGNQIMFIGNELDESSVYIINIDGSNLRSFPRSGAPYFIVDWLQWLPDSNHLVLPEFHRLGSITFRTIDVFDFSETEHVLDETGVCLVYSLSPDGQHIVFQPDMSLTGDSCAGLSIMNVDNTNQRDYFVDDESIPYALWSPDSRQLVVADGEFLYLLSDINSDVFIQVSGDEIFRNPRPIAWSPDSTKIIFASGESLDALYTLDIRPELGIPRLLVRSFTEYEAIWSADSKQIAYISNNEIYIVNTADSSTQHIIFEDFLERSWLVWLP
jgi:Tol biopolymer transport system component